MTDIDVSDHTICRCYMQQSTNRNSVTQIMTTLLQNHKNIQILTPTGFQPFEGLMCKTTSKYIRITTTSGDLECTVDHRVFSNGVELQAKQLRPGMIITTHGNVRIVRIVNVRLILEPTRVYDVVEVANGNVYFTNGILSHNCEFLSSDALLIDSIALASLGVLPDVFPDMMGIKWWEDFEKDKVYLMGIDPSTGSGSDFSVITIFKFPEMRQIAEFRSNTTKSVELYKTLRHILKLSLKNKVKELFYSIENNGVGEGIISLIQADEDPVDAGEFISEEGRARYGMTTTAKEKLKACVLLKNMFEASKITIKSPTLLAELKSYKRKKSSYEAEIGSTDDCISAVLIVTRLLREVAMYEDEAYDMLYKIHDDISSNPSNKTSTEQYDENEEVPAMMGGGAEGAFSQDDILELMGLKR